MRGLLMKSGKKRDKRETGNGKQETGNGKRETGNGKTGDRRRETGDGKQETGRWEDGGLNELPRMTSPGLQPRDERETHTIIPDPGVRK